MIELWSYPLAVVNLLGIYIAGKSNEWGWAIGVFAQVLWAIYSIATKQYGFLISCVGLTYFYGYNFYKWRKNKNEVS